VAAAVQPAADRIEVVREIEPALPALTLDGRLVRQAILNIAVNAVQAMPRGGRLTVRARRDGAALLVEIEDTGAGIPDEVRERIFEPFFTTKASGTGLGLAVVRRIVEGHGGEVRVHSTPGAGTTFALRFPLDGAPVENDPAMR
jgi:signal transduction histidine kinase